MAAVERCPAGSARAQLGRVCDLYVLATIEAGLAWFLAHGRLTATRAKTVTAAVNDLCAELRPHPQTLVDAFAIPGPFLGAAILAGTPGTRPAGAPAPAPQCVIRAAGRTVPVMSERRTARRTRNGQVVACADGQPRWRRRPRRRPRRAAGLRPS